MTLCIAEINKEDRLPPLGIVQAMGQVYSTNSTITGGSTSLPRVIQVCGRLRNFWTGTYPSLWRCVPGVGAYFMCLNALQDITDRWNILTPSTANTPTTAVKSFMLAFTARGIVAFCLDPFVVIKTQLESGLYSQDRRSMLRTFQRIYSSAKWRGLYSGVWATIMRDCPYSGLYLAAYTSLRQYTGLYSPFQKNIDAADDGNVKSFLYVSGCAALAACFATTLTHPADLLRVHRQLLIRETCHQHHNHQQQQQHQSPTNRNASTYKNQKTADKQQLSSLFQIFQSIYTKYGVKGLCQGLSLRLIRRTIFGVTSWTLYEFFT
ncbi:unnamed protein product [Trichobilharzia szidati]|nr:unnamed protein product [Trichobilharzia szidati]